MNKKIHTPLAILIILLVITTIISAVFWIYLERKKVALFEDKTSNWEIYRSEEYGYEIKYPKDWISDNLDENVISFISPENEILYKKVKAGELYGIGYVPDVLISYYETVSEDEENITNHLRATTIDELIERNTGIISSNQINFVGKKAYEVMRGGLYEDEAHYSILIEENSHLYMILFGNRELTNTEELILSTFRFTEKAINNSNITNEISASVVAHSINDAEDVTFSIIISSEESDIAKVTYWTDKFGSCKAKTEAFNKLISVPLDDIDKYVFFEFTNKGGYTSDIYVASPYPIHQCGNLAE